MPPNAASPDELADWHMHSVLVVDDEPGMVNFLRRALAARCGVLDSAGDVASAAADRKSTRLNSSHLKLTRMPSSA